MLTYVLNLVHFDHEDHSPKTMPKRNRRVSPGGKGTVDRLFGAIVTGEVLLPPASKSLSSIAKGLHELRMRDASGQYRVIYLMRSRDAIYLLHGFKKKTQHIELKVRRTIKERLQQV